jgi:hypothetical protein
MKEMKRGNIAIRQTPFYWIPKVLIRKYNPSWRAILAYNALAYYTNGESGSCEKFSLKTLASLVNTSKWTILRGLEELEEKGAVRRTRRSKKSESGGRIPLPTLYELIDLDAIGGEPI